MRGGRIGGARGGWRGRGVLRPGVREKRVSAGDDKILFLRILFASQP